MILQKAVEKIPDFLSFSRKWSFFQDSFQSFVRVHAFMVSQEPIHWVPTMCLPLYFVSAQNTAMKSRALCKQGTKCRYNFSADKWCEGKQSRLSRDWWDGSALLDRIGGKESLTWWHWSRDLNKVSYVEWMSKTSHIDKCGNSFPGKGNCKCKGPRWDWAPSVWEGARKSRMLPQGERWGEEEE